MQIKGKWKLFIYVMSTMLFLLIFAVGYASFYFDFSRDKLLASSVPFVDTLEDRKLDEKPVVEVPKASKVIEEDDEVKADILQTEKGVMYILVLGVDARGSHLRGRTDAMLVLRADSDLDRLDIVSIPRDAYVEINGSGKYDKITHAYAYGGIDSARKTVEDLLRIEFDHYVVFNFTSFVKVIDQLGGIEIDVPYAFSEQDSNDVQNAIHLSKGLQVLNGEEALAYARMRKKDPKGDVGRGERQQEVINAVLTKVGESKNPAEIVQLIDTVNKNIASDLGVLDVPRLMAYLGVRNNVQKHTMSGEGIRKNGIYYMQLNNSDVEAVREVLKGGS